MAKSAFFSKLIQSGQFNVEDSGHAMLLGEYLLMVPPSVMLKLQADLEKALGKKKAAKLLSDLGEYQIDQALKRYERKFGMWKIDKRKILDFEENILNILGWGSFRLEKLSFEEKRATMVISNNVLPLKYLEINNKSMSGSPIDFYIVGVLKRIFSTLFEKDVKVVETKCMAKGDKYCEFDIS